MGRSIPIVPGQAFVEEAIYEGEQRFRWSCSCKLDESWSMRKSTRDVWTALEAFRQHWANVHGREFRPSINWYEIHKKMPWLIDGDERGGMFASASSPYFSTEQEKKGMSRLSDIQARMRELEKEAAKYERFEKSDPYPAGTVITYDYQPIGVDSLYTYAVLKASNGLWYWTGAQGGTRRGHDYDALVDSLADEQTQNIRVAFPDDFEPLFQTLEEVVGPEVAAQVEEALKEPGTFMPRVRPEK